MDEDLRIAAKAEEAVAYVVRARGCLYEFHHLIGRADILFAEVAEQRPGLADPVVGRSTVEDKWTYQLVSDFDAGYYADAVAAAGAIRAALAGGRAHAPEAEMKREGRTYPG